MFPVQDVWGGILGKAYNYFSKIQSHLAISPLLMRTSMMSRLTPSDPSDEPTMKWSTHCTHKQKELQTTNGLHVLVLSTSKGFEQQWRWQLICIHSDTDNLYTQWHWQSLYTLTLTICLHTDTDNLYTHWYWQSFWTVCTMISPSKNKACTTLFPVHFVHGHGP